MKKWSKEPSSIALTNQDTTWPYHIDALWQPHATSVSSQQSSEPEPSPSFLVPPFFPPGGEPYACVRQPFPVKSSLKPKRHHLKLGADY
jgi:hypothetical protein